MILDIYRVFARTSTTDPYLEIYPVDVQTDREDIISNIADGLNTQGKPYNYDKTANGLFLDPIPDANVTNGLKVYINREASYFTYTDTTKLPGVSGILHEWFYKRPAFEYAKRNSLSNVNSLALDIENLKKSIKEHYASRERDVRHIISPKITNYI